MIHTCPRFSSHQDEGLELLTFDWIRNQFDINMFEWLFDYRLEKEKKSHNWEPNCISDEPNCRIFRLKKKGYAGTINWKK
jgi:hypothetical protein